MVDVVTGAVRQDDVHEARVIVDGCLGDPSIEPARIAQRILFLVVPLDAGERRGCIGVDQQRRRQDGIELARPARRDPVFGLYAADLGNRHGLNLRRRKRN